MDASTSDTREEQIQLARSAAGNGNGGNGGQAGKVTLCHFPPGNPGNPQTLSVGASAVPAHLAHGDTLGACGSTLPDTVPTACGILQSWVDETWDRFDSTLWRGDGNQATAGGFFFAQEGSYGATADWLSPGLVALQAGHAAFFSNLLRLDSPSEADFAQSGALFLVNADTGSTFQNFVFVNVGYTLAPSRVFVEMFGSNAGQDFDQFEETSLAYAPGLSFNLDLWVLPSAYQVGVNGLMVDTVPLAAPLTSLGLFEVGVQHNLDGLRGSIDRSDISTLCQAGTVLVHTAHTPYRNRKRERLGPQGKSRNAFIREAKAKLDGTAHPSKGMRILASMQERPEFE